MISNKLQGKLITFYHISFFEKYHCYSCNAEHNYRVNSDKIILFSANAL